VDTLYFATLFLQKGLRIELKQNIKTQYLNEIYDFCYIEKFLIFKNELLKDECLASVEGVY
jgi:hypothetical protein